MPKTQIDIRKDFPILDSQINGKKLVYLDSAATSQKPISVINKMRDFMLESNGTVRRGVYDLSVKSTQEFDRTRTLVQELLNSKDTEEIIFTRGTTEAINLIAFSLCEALRGNLSPYGTHDTRKSKLRTSDKDFKILVSGLEHHANIVPWQIQAARIGAGIEVIPVLDNGELDQEAYFKLISSGKIKILALTHISNSLGTINPVKDMIKLARAYNVITVIDGAQGVNHSAVDVQDLDCDFYVFSGHKLYGPTGVGVLYGKREILEELPPYHGGGEMIDKVSFEKTSYGALPFKFEAGTPPIVEVIGLGNAIDYINAIGMDYITEIEDALHKSLEEKLLEIPGLKIIGQAKDKAAISSFVFSDIEAFDIGTMLNEHGIAIRTGHHCAQPVMRRFGISATSRASLAFYNNNDDIERFIEALNKTVKIFR